MDVGFESRMSVVHLRRNSQSAGRSDWAFVDEFEDSDKEQCGDGGENPGYGCNIPERIG